MRKCNGLDCSNPIECCGIHELECGCVIGKRQIPFDVKRSCQLLRILKAEIAGELELEPHTEFEPWEIHEIIVLHESYLNETKKYH